MRQNKRPLIQFVARLLPLLLATGGCAPTTAPTSNRAAATSPPECKVVLRHHPGMMATVWSEQDWGDRDADVEVIIAELDDAKIGYEYAGGLGSGYELTVSSERLADWKRLIDRLVREGKLKYYTYWGLDDHGFGLVPLH